jgi:hypothetical protein
MGRCALAISMVMARMKLLSELLLGNFLCSDTTHLIGKAGRSHFDTNTCNPTLASVEVLDSVECTPSLAHYADR